MPMSCQCVRGGLGGTAAGLGWSSVCQVRQYCLVAVFDPHERPNLLTHLYRRLSVGCLGDGHADCAGASVTERHVADDRIPL